MWHFLGSTEDEVCLNNMFEIPGGVVFLSGHFESSALLKMRHLICLRSVSWDLRPCSLAPIAVLGCFLH